MSPLKVALASLILSLSVSHAGASESDLSWTRGESQEHYENFDRTDGKAELSLTTGKKALDACKTEAASGNEWPAMNCPFAESVKQYRQFLWYLYDTRRSYRSRILKIAPILGHKYGVKKYRGGYFMLASFPGAWTEVEVFDVHYFKIGKWDRLYEYLNSNLVSENSTYEQAMSGSDMSRELQQRVHERIVKDFLRGKFSDETIQKNYEQIIDDINHLETIVKVE